jgi:hypothetical protein
MVESIAVAEVVETAESGVKLNKLMELPPVVLVYSVIAFIPGVVTAAMIQIANGEWTTPSMVVAAGFTAVGAAKGLYDGIVYAASPNV